MERNMIPATRKPETEWSGLTLDELRYRRALTMARIEITKELLAIQARQMYDSKVTAPAHRRGILGRMISTLSIVDYAVIALKFGKKMTSIYRSIRR